MNETQDFFIYLILLVGFCIFVLFLTETHTYNQPIYDNQYEMYDTAGRPIVP